MTYSWHNVAARYNNIQLKWRKKGEAWKTLTVPDGMYCYTSLASFLQARTGFVDPYATDKKHIFNLRKTTSSTFPSVSSWTCSALTKKSCKIRQASSATGSRTSREASIGFSYTAIWSQGMCKTSPPMFCSAFPQWVSSSGGTFPPRISPHQQNPNRQCAHPDLGWGKQHFGPQRLQRGFVPRDPRSRLNFLQRYTRMPCLSEWTKIFDPRFGRFRIKHKDSGVIRDVLAPLIQQAERQAAASDSETHRTVQPLHHEPFLFQPSASQLPFFGLASTFAPNGKAPLPLAHSPSRKFS